jgi:preprotein translocase subunit SecD
MRDNGFKIFLVVGFLALCLWYLWPTLDTYLTERQLATLSDDEQTEFVEANYDDIRDTRERSLKLGLDLQGGMHVTLEVGLKELLRELAQTRDEQFDAALDAADARILAGESDDFVDAFVSELQARDPNVTLSRYFRGAGTIERRSTNEEVVLALKAEALDAVDRAVSIIRQRVDRYGVSEPSIQKQGQSRVVVELPGVDEPERVRDLLRGTARLEFRLMAEPNELAQARNRIFAYYEQERNPEPAAEVETDTTAMEADGDEVDGDLEAEEVAEATEDAEPVQDVSEADGVDDLFGATDAAEDEIGNPLARILQPMQGTRFGAVALSDTAEARALLDRPEVEAMLPGGIKLMYTASAEAQSENGEPVFFLLGVRDRYELTGEVITDARPSFDPYTNEPEVSLAMNADGAQTWARLTGANINKQVAIVLDNVVYSYPVIQSKITGGRTSINGVSRTEAEDIVTVLKSGALPAPVQIMEERTVGPSLGAASIRAGTLSILIGLGLVAIFMVVYYRTAGVIANVALLLNILFIFGILAAFKATLTLPGIAGIVLTIGMAVDANVIIFDRIREEMRSGKTLKAAIDGGYAKALSAIADANITTFFVGVILYSFGVGPIQGFAVTLMAGIVSSLFTAIVVTRIIFDYLVSERRSSVAFG